VRVEHDHGPEVRTLGQSGLSAADHDIEVTGAGHHQAGSTQPIPDQIGLPGLGNQYQSPPQPVLLRCQRARAHRQLDQRSRPGQLVLPRWDPHHPRPTGSQTGQERVVFDPV
jgi:hypothetical protein